MADESKVRLVRCPNCQKILPELPHLSVYQCGGCGTVLRSKEGIKDELLLAESDDGKGDFDEAGTNLVIGSENEKESGEILTVTKKGRDCHVKFVDPSSSSLPRTGNREAFIDSTLDQSTGVGFYNGRYGQSPKFLIKNRVQESNHELSMNRRGFLNLANEHEEIRSPTGSLRSRHILEKWSMECNGSVINGENLRSVQEQGTFTSLPYSDEGTSNYRRDYFYGYQERQTRNYDEQLGGLSAVANLERDRAELLKQLDELKGRFSRSCSVAEKEKEMVGVDKKMAPSRSYNNGGDVHCVDRHPLARGNHVPIYACHNHGPIPYVSNHVTDIQHFYHNPRNIPNEVLGNEDSYRQPMLWRPPLQRPSRSLQQPYQDHFPGRYADFHQDPLVSHPAQCFNQPACSCMNCYHKSWQVLPKDRAPDFTTTPISYHQVNPVKYDPRLFNAEGSDFRQVYSPHRQMRSSSDHDSDSGSFGQYHRRRVVVSVGNRRVCHPMAGGAPFITCWKCFELLKMPSKIMVMDNNERKMRCGACSSTILFGHEDKRHDVSVPAQIKLVSGEIGSNCDEIMNEIPVRSHKYLKAGANNCCSDNDDDGTTLSNIEFKATTLLQRDQRTKPTKPEEVRDPQLSLSVVSEDEKSPDSMIIQRVDSSTAERLSKEDVPSSLCELPDYSSSSKIVPHTQEGENKSKIAQGKVIVDGSASRNNTVLDEAPLATEMEVSYSGVSHETMEVSNEFDQPKNYGGDSFFAGLIKKSLRDLSRSSQHAENGVSNVFVNGHLIPVRLVKKAEKLAGTIQPGDYWYDYQAGFWGIMGQPCLGIIPPYIEEFNYPMPENCSNGNTRVFANGRELHQKDLDLLAGRGLPVTRHKSYIIYLSGKVLDELTGEELESLGKLAPTVEKVKRGFGMKVPRALAQQPC